MQSFYKIFLFSIFFILLNECGESNIKPMPAWIDEPEKGAVGSCTTHIRGRHYQEELAISRARERLAARYGVEVTSVQTINEKVVNNRSYITSDKEILQHVNKTTVRAHVREIWHDKKRDEVWAWVYPISN